MAAKRVAKTAVNWAAFRERVTPSDTNKFMKFKALNDGYAGRVNELPESLPSIDFQSYKARGAPAAVVDRLEKSYAAVKVPYPVDSENLVQKIDKQHAEAEVLKKKSVASMQQNIKDLQKLEEERDAFLWEYFAEMDSPEEFEGFDDVNFNKIDVAKKAFPERDEWTMQMLMAYFPDNFPNPEERPTFWPHTPLDPEKFGPKTIQNSQPRYLFDTRAGVLGIKDAPTNKHKYTYLRDYDENLDMDMKEDPDIKKKFLSK